MIAVYPTVRDNPDLNKLVEDYPDALKAFIAFGGDLDYVSGAGYLGSELFAFMVPLLLLDRRDRCRGTGDRRRGGGRYARPLLANPRLAPAARLREARGPRRRDRAAGRVVSGSRSSSVSRSSGWTSRRRTWPPRRRAPRCSRSPSARSRCSLGAATGAAGSRSASPPPLAVAAYLVSSLALARRLPRAREEGLALLPLRRLRSAPARLGARSCRVPRALALAAGVLSTVAFDRRDLAA